MRRIHILLQKYTLLIPAVVYGIIALGSIALADQCQPGQFCNPINANSFPDLVVTIANLVAFVASPVVVIFLIYSGFLFVSARGNESQITKAKETIWYTLIGAAIVIGAYAIAQAVVDFAKEL